MNRSPATWVPSWLVGRLIGVEEAVVEGFDIVDDQAKGRLVLAVQVRPHRRAKPRCSQCGVRCPGYDQGGGQRRWRALDLGEIVVYLAATMFRVTCPDHGVVVAKDAPMDVKRPEQESSFGVAAETRVR